MVYTLRQRGRWSVMNSHDPKELDRLSLAELTTFSYLMKCIISRLLIAGEREQSLVEDMNAALILLLEDAELSLHLREPRSLIVRVRLTRLLVRLIGTALTGSLKTTSVNDLTLRSEWSALILELAELRSSLTSALVATENSKTD